MRPIRLAFLILAVSLALGTGSGGGAVPVAPGPVPLSGPAVPVVFPAAGFAMVLNDLRRSEGRAAVRVSARLARAAQAHAEWLAERGRLSHGGWRGTQPEDRARAEGCRRGAVAELLASGPESAGEAVRAWAGDPERRATLLAPEARLFGLGRSGRTWVLMLADRC